MRQIPSLVSCCLIVVLALSLAACGPGSPEERVAATRAQYTVKLESFTAERPAPEEPEIAMAEEGAEAVEAVAADAEAAEAGAEEGTEIAEDMAAAEATGSGPQPTDIVLHLLVRFGGDQALPGITVEVTQADPFGKEKPPTLHWIDTAGMVKSDVKQIDLRLEGVEFEEGDAFAVVLRESVPAAERSQYREFATAAP